MAKVTRIDKVLPGNTIASVKKAIATGNATVGEDFGIRYNGVLIAFCSYTGYAGSIEGKKSTSTSNGEAKMDTVKEEVIEVAMINKDFATGALKRQGGTLALNGIMKYVKLPFGMGRMKKNRFFRLAVANFVLVGARKAGKESVITAAEAMVDSAVDSGIGQLERATSKFRTAR